MCKVFRGSNRRRGSTGEQVFLVVVRDGVPGADRFLLFLLVREGLEERI
jgi:hypothetical protein